MTDAPAASADKPATDKPTDEWKPEPRQWTWKDLFTAPMLAFKPKCMVVSALTLAVIGLWYWLYAQCDFAHEYTLKSNLIDWAWGLVALVIFSLGASLVAVFLKADLLDDEFLSFGEAIAQYKTRVVPAVLVPVFLVALLGGVYVALIYLPALASSIPFVGPTLYAILYPLVFLFSLFGFLLAIAVWLSTFVFPSIIAIRKHGWFDNVVDTIEAVGTKPHILAASLLLSLIMMGFASWIGLGAMAQLKAQTRYLPGDANVVQQTESRAKEFAQVVLDGFDQHVSAHVDPSHSLLQVGASTLSSAFYGTPSGSSYSRGAYQQNVTGPIAGVWQGIILALILGYVANLFIAGGMLTYLLVREDDYWDDEDLEDLDKLAKELEEEAKRDQAAPAPAAAAPVPAPVATVPAPAPTAPVAPAADTGAPPPAAAT